MGSEALRQLKQLLQEQLEASRAEADGLARCCAHAERLLEKTRPAGASDSSEQELDFEMEKWWQWRQLRSKYSQFKSQESSLREAAHKARSTFKQQLLESSRTCSRETDEKFAKACMLAKLCTFAAEEVLPSPEQFFISKGLWPDQGEPQVLEFCQLFLYIALEKWLARLSQEAAKEVPPVAMAVGAAQRLKELRKRDEHGLRAASPCNESHPLTLLQQLPGGEPAVKAILQAKHKAQQMEVESQIMRICCGPLEDEDDAVTAKVPTILDEVESILNDGPEKGSSQLKRALELLRLAEHLCSARRMMLSYWPLPDASPESDKKLL